MYICVPDKVYDIFSLISFYLRIVNHNKTERLFLIFQKKITE
jgi:hypothetical protein